VKRTKLFSQPAAIVDRPAGDVDAVVDQNYFVLWKQVSQAGDNAFGHADRFHDIFQGKAVERFQWQSKMPGEDKSRVRGHRSDARRDVIPGDVRVEDLDLVLAYEIGYAHRAQHAEGIANGDPEMALSRQEIKFMLPFARRAVRDKNIVPASRKPAGKVDKMPLAASVRACR
jgi:hypothetical protein